jgi:hypothetical protein
MGAETTVDPPYDSRWLDDLANVCSMLARANPQLVDLFLERRLELRVVSSGGSQWVEECRTEGAAARWRFPNRTALSARSGVSPQDVSSLLAGTGERVVLPTARPVPPADIDPPRGWRRWACELAARLSNGRTVVRFLSRQGVVVGPRRWAAATSPPLLRVEVDQVTQTALLAVWDHPELNRWLHELVDPPPARPWYPESGVSLPVLFAAGTGGILMHELVGHSVESDLALCGDSPLVALDDALITAATIHITDDPSRTDLPGAFSHDDEGLQARPQTLVSDGRLVGWLCDREGGEELGCAPGRGRRATWDRAPSSRMSNLVVAPGNTAPEAIESGLGHGLVVTRLGGATLDPVSNRLVLRVERGWEIHAGRRRRPLGTIELTGGALEVLAHIDPTVGSDPTTDWRLGWCVKDGVPLPTGSESPSLLVHRLEVL